ncbi:MAG TPA: choice-of-anchor A family protein [Leptolyngbyaceae cyanobacterium]
MQLNKLSNQVKLAAPIAASLLALSFSTQAHAASLGVASDYNVFTLGNFNQTSTDVEGKLAVGGNATFTGGFGVGSRLSSNSGNVLVTGGNLNLNNGQVYNGNAIYGGTANVSGVGFPSGNLSQGNPLDFNAAGDYLKGLSSYLGSLTSNGTKNIAYGGISLTGSDSNLNIFNLSASDLASANSFNINVANGSTVVVNVSGATASMQYFGFNINGSPENAQRQKVLYNFYEATNLNATGIGIQGSILAPLAAVNFNNGQINGHLIAASLTGNGESHNYLFNGTLPDVPSNDDEVDPETVKSVPEPSVLLSLGLVSSLLGVVRRQRQRQE